VPIVSTSSSRVAEQQEIEEFNFVDPTKEADSDADSEADFDETERPQGWSRGIWISC